MCAPAVSLHSVSSATRLTEGQIHALDNCSIASDPLVVGDGEFLHVGRIHPHLARTRDHRGIDSRDTGQKSGGLTSIELNLSRCSAHK